MILNLNGIDVDCIIGDRADERDSPQRLMVDIQLEIGDEAALSDSLDDTVDYATLTDEVRSTLVKAKCRMIERAAKVVCDLCMGDARVRTATVRVTKAGAVPHLSSATATCMGQRL